MTHLTTWTRNRIVSTVVEMLIFSTNRRGSVSASVGNKRCIFDLFSFVYSAKLKISRTLDHIIYIYTLIYKKPKILINIKNQSVRKHHSAQYRAVLYHTNSQKQNAASGMLYLYANKNSHAHCRCSG